MELSKCTYVVLYEQNGLSFNHTLVSSFLLNAVIFVFGMKVFIMFSLILLGLCGLETCSSSQAYGYHE